MCDIMEIEQPSLELVNKIEEKTAVICIVGLGQVGLPTALSFLKLGYRVIGYDINEKLIRNLEAGISEFPEKGFKDLINRFLKSKSFTLSVFSNVLASADVIIICVASPLDSTGFAVDMKYLVSAIEAVVKYLTPQKLIVVESTLPPGAMKKYVIPLFESLCKKRAGSDFLISFCPERVSPGNALQEFNQNDRIIGANDDNSYLSTLALFKNITNGKIHRTDTTTAEISKLAENSYRDINIAFANELAIICEQSDTDVQDVIRLANTHPRVNIHKPGPGVGGPCLPKDPYLLIMGKNFDKSIVKTARWINDSMPSHIVDILTKTMHSNKISKDNLNVLILGISYKPGVNDTRYSPTRSIVSSLKKQGFQNIILHDPFTDDACGVKFNSDLNSALGSADCVIIATAHSIYSSLSTKDFKKDCIIVDAVRLLNKDKFLDGRLTYIALGA
jgi:UDP-N-acetyl-D-mannosaminuronic acid dehydrogenase